MPTSCDMWLLYSTHLQTNHMALALLSNDVFSSVTESEAVWVFGCILVSATKQLYHIWLLAKKEEK